jgi:uncharacterized protein
MAIIKLILPLLAIYLLLRRKYSLGIAMAGGAIVLGLFYAATPEKMVLVAGQALFSPGALQLFAAFYVIMFLEHMLRVNGVLDRLMHASRVVISDARVVMAVMPAFLGFLPSLGGALFSAPLVNKASEGINISAERKFLINYWYRHVWEYFVPIYPSLLLAQQILNVPMRDFITQGWIYTVLAVAVGALLCFRDVPKSGKVQEAQNEPVTAAHYWDMALALGPVAVILILVVLCKVSVILATGSVLVVLMVRFRYNVEKFLGGVKEAFHVRTFSAVAGVLIFKEMLIQAGAIREIVASISTLPVASVVLVGFMAFLVAWITGMPQAAVGMVFPLIAVIDPGNAAMGVMAMVCITAGQMMSPMHLCLIVTQEYFKCRIGNTLVQVAQGQAVLVVAAYGIYYLMQ